MSAGGERPRIRARIAIKTTPSSHPATAYTMLVTGIPRILGNLIAGPIARRTLTGVFGYSAILCIIAAALILIAFYEEAAEAAPVNIAADAT